MTLTHLRLPNTALTVLLLVALGGANACSDDSPTPVLEEPAAVVEPSVGAHFDGGSIRLGDTLGDVQAVFGPAGSVRDLGLLGVRFDYADLGLSGLLSSSGEAATVVRLTLYTESNATLIEGVGIGSSEADVRTAMGEPVRDPFLEVWWYSGSGVGFEWGADGVERIHIAGSDG